MPSEQPFQKRCAACGRLVDWDALTCPYCEDDRELRLQLAQTHDPPELANEPRTDTREIASSVQREALVSVAINVRRIALILILGVTVSVGSVLVSMMSSVASIDRLTYLNLVKAWLVLAVGAMLVGLLYIVRNNRLSKLS